MRIRNSEIKNHQSKIGIRNKKGRLYYVSAPGLFILQACDYRTSLEGNANPGLECSVLRLCRHIAYGYGAGCVYIQVGRGVWRRRASAVRIQHIYRVIAGRRRVVEYVSRVDTKLNPLAFHELN